MWTGYRISIDRPFGDGRRGEQMFERQPLSIYVECCGIIIFFEFVRDSNVCQRGILLSRRKGYLSLFPA